MKHLGASHARLLSGLIAEAGLEVTEQAQSLALRHLDWVLEKNLTLNLTSVTNPADAVRLHTVDSLMALPEIGDAPGGMMIDLGSGAGFPGIPLALVSGRHTLLLDSVGKKARAVQECVIELGLDGTVDVWPVRAEQAQLDPANRAGIVIARAVSSLPSLVELAWPLLQQGGWLVAMKGRADEAEVSRGDEAGKLTAMRLLTLREYALPGGGELRSVYVYERVGNASIRLPRRTGLAQRRPLA